RENDVVTPSLKPVPACGSVSRGVHNDRVRKGAFPGLDGHRHPPDHVAPGHDLDPLSFVHRVLACRLDASDDSCRENESASVKRDIDGNNAPTGAGDYSDGKGD